MRSPDDYCTIFAPNPTAPVSHRCRTCTFPLSRRDETGCIIAARNREKRDADKRKKES